MVERSSDEPRLSTWFWAPLESSDRGLRSLSGALEQLAREELIAYRVQYDEAKAEVNAVLCEAYFPHLSDPCSEDDGDDFAAWVVMQGQPFYEAVRANPGSIQRHLDRFRESEIGGDGPAPRWDDSVDREEYRGYQRADMIA